MNYYQSSLFEPKSHSLNTQVAEVLNCQDELVLTAISRAIDNFLLLPKQEKYSLAFSGGKDSCALLGVYCLYLKLGFEPLDVVVVFADTKLEHHSLYQAINLVQEFAIANNIPFSKIIGKRSYWYSQFAIGYPVPNFRLRWCTFRLKIDPIKKMKRKSLTGRHFGESINRDKRLNCNNNDCGMDEIKQSYDPIIHFRNCLVWDSLFYFDGVVLPEGIFNLLKAQYAQAEDTKTGSLRMGCFICPVVTINTITKNLNDGIIDREGFRTRVLLDELREARRINSPKTEKAGAIYIEDRKITWNKLGKDYLIENGWLEPEDEKAIDLALESNYAYPQSYKKEWIDREHLRLETT